MSCHSSKRVFLDIAIGALFEGRVIIELFDRIVPKTCENFRALCTGEYGIVRGVNMTYRGSPFHRIVKNSLIQGGDITEGDGSGGMSIYGQLFDDEEVMGYHSEPYLVSMANCGPNTNSSQFFITTSIAPQFDSEYVVFGRIVKGIEVIRTIEKFSVNENFQPFLPISIMHCGELFRELRIIEKWIEKKPEKRDLVKRSRSNSEDSDKLFKKIVDVHNEDEIESSDSEIVISSISSEGTTYQDNLSDNLENDTSDKKHETEEKALLN